MGRRGGFRHNYDATAMYRYVTDPDATGQLGQVISERVLGAVEDTLDDIAGTLVEQHGIHPDVARLLVTQRAAESLDFLRWVRAGEARAAGVPVRGLMDAMGYSSPTSISRMVPTLDHVAAVLTRVGATGDAEDVHDDRGYRVTLTPREDAAAIVEQARKRGLVSDDGNE